MLEIGEFPVKTIKFGEQTGFDRGCLTLKREELQELVSGRDGRVEEVAVHLCCPSESARIVCVKDVIEPRIKISGDSSGNGHVHVIKNAAVVTCGQIVGFQEGIIDMSGPGALYSPFSETFNVVVDITVRNGLPPHEHEECVREVGLAAADYLAQAVKTAEPETIRTYSSLSDTPKRSELPKIVYVYPLLTQGLLHDNYLFGVNCREMLPQIIDPLVLLDGAIVSGNCVSACDKNTTYHHQNNPILLELLSRHGKDLWFGGVVLTSEPVRLALKEQAACKTVELVEQIGCDGVILSKEGFGNPDSDQMMLIDGLEAAGIQCCALTDEFAGDDGSSQSLADVCVKADAMVSVGNANERITLPPMDRLLGPMENISQLAGAYPQSLHHDGCIEIELQGIIGATNELGYSSLSCREI